MNSSPFDPRLESCLTETKPLTRMVDDARSAPADLENVPPFGHRDDAGTDDLGKPHVDLVLEVRRKERLGDYTGNPKVAHCLRRGVMRMAVAEISGADDLVHVEIHCLEDVGDAAVNWGKFHRLAAR